MIYEPFSIVLVPFPFTDKNTTKKRPALTISTVEYQQHTSHITLLMITSAKNSAWYNDHAIRFLEEAGLNTPSMIRQKIFTLDSQLILKKIGALSSKDKKEVLKQISNHLYLS